MSKPVPYGTPPPGSGPAGPGPGRGWRTRAGTHPGGMAGVRPPASGEHRPEPEEDGEGGE